MDPDLTLSELFQLTQQVAAGGEVPILAWEDIMEVVNKLGIPENKVVECLKYIELLGHIMYFPGKHDSPFLILQSRYRRPEKET